MKLSKRVQKIEPSLARKLFNMAQQYDDVIDLTLGDPDLFPEITIRDAASLAISLGKTRYSANAGLIKLRKVITEHIKKNYSITVDAKSEVIVTVGGMEALFLALSTLIDDGDEVIVPGPYYVNYIQMIRACGGVPIVIDTKEENDFLFTIDQVKNAINEKTVAIIINTPSNPTGQVLPVDILENLSRVIKENKLVVITDEVYSSLIYDGKQHCSLFNMEGMKEYAILIDSCSKRFAMTGYRVGYAIGPAKVIEAMTRMQENVAACAPLPSQYAAIEAYTKCSESTYLRDEFEKRRNFIYDAINNIEGLHANKPAATFYLFVNISSTKMDSVTFAEKLLEFAHVAVTPGITYGKAYDDFVRIAFTLDINKLKLAIERIRQFMEEL